MKVQNFLVVFLLAGALVFAPMSTAFAQNNNGDYIVGDLYSTTTTGLTTAAIAGGVILTVMLVSGSSQNVEAYLRDNAVAVQHDLHTGGGDATDDLARVFNVPETMDDQFAAILFENRSELAGLAQPGEVNADSAAMFTQIVVDGMLDDPDLAVHLRTNLS